MRAEGRTNTLQTKSSWDQRNLLSPQTCVNDFVQNTIHLQLVSDLVHPGAQARFIDT